MTVVRVKGEDMIAVKDASSELADLESIIVGYLNHSFRHAFGTHLYENGTDLLTIKALLGHRSLNSTTIYVHLASNRFSSVVNPLDRMGGFHAG